MKKFIIVLIFLLIATTGNAKTYIIINQDKEVVSLSPIDDAQLEDGQEKIVIEEKFKNIKLTAHPIYYTYENGNFIKNIDKISKKENKKKEAEKKKKEFNMIKKRSMKIAFESLVGVEFKYYTIEDFE